MSLSYFRRLVATAVFRNPGITFHELESLDELRHYDLEHSINCLGVMNGIIYRRGFKLFVYKKWVRENAPHLLDKK